MSSKVRGSLCPCICVLVIDVILTLPVSHSCPLFLSVGMFVHAIAVQLSLDVGCTANLPLWSLDPHFSIFDGPIFSLLQHAEPLLFRFIALSFIILFLYAGRHCAVNMLL